MIVVVVAVDRIIDANANVRCRRDLEDFGMLKPSHLDFRHIL